MSDIENQVRTLIDQSVTCKMRDPRESIVDLEKERLELKAKIKVYNKLKREGVISFGQALELTCFKLNLKGIENQICYKQAQLEQGTTGPVRIC